MLLQSAGALALRPSILSSPSAGSVWGGCATANAGACSWPSAAAGGCSTSCGKMAPGGNTSGTDVPPGACKMMGATTGTDWGPDCNSKDCPSVPLPRQLS
ncbi:hypothetical protein Vafri_7249, partial [Volvox africanus]